MTEFLLQGNDNAQFSEEGFPAIKHGRVHDQHPIKTTLSPIPRTPPLPREERNSAVPTVSWSAKGSLKERADGLDNIKVCRGAKREEAEVIQIQAEKKAPDSGTNRKLSDVFSAQDDSKDAKRPKVTEELEARKPAK